MRATPWLAILCLALAAGACDRGPHQAATGATAAAARASDPPAVGTVAPGGTLQAPDGTQVALADRWAANDETVVVFYRGYF
ncbi:MAG TPA: hypothetical protein VHE35_37580 [Kofleriaceae bacterium]|nr:hypothetical protein [Kofleriaceae bacterium]